MRHAGLVFLLWIGFLAAERVAADPQLRPRRGRSMRCNSLWAFQSVEGAIRTFYPARRLEREWGLPIINGKAAIELGPQGLGALRLVPR